MNDNHKSVMELALDAVRSAHNTDDLSDAELRELLNEFRMKLAAKDFIASDRSH